MKDTILFGISSGIAAYKVVKLIDQLKVEKFKLDIILTENAEKMLGGFSLEDFHKELYPKDFDYREILEKREVEHIQIADSAKIFVIAPATANIIAKLANGIADDFLTTTALAVNCPILLIPSMNVNMWANPVVQENIQKMRLRGIIVMEPDSGPLACGYDGRGRLPEIDSIRSKIFEVIDSTTDLAGKKILITAGGTEEKIDDVRVISNKSSGKMGISLGYQAYKMGADITFILGRVEKLPEFPSKVIKINSAENMMKELSNLKQDYDLIFHAAAVSDFKILDNNISKISSKNEVDLHLIPNEKIIDQLRQLQSSAKIYGFKAESGIGKEELKRKSKKMMKRAHLDGVIANDVGEGRVFGQDYTEVHFITKNDSIFMERDSKLSISKKILDIISKQI